jgi:hypothetical protein
MKGSKEISSGKGDFAKGGSGSMYSVRYPKSGSKDSLAGGKGEKQTYAGQQKPGVSSHEVKDTSGKWGKGGNTKMFGYKGVVTATAGKSSAR